MIDESVKLDELQLASDNFTKLNIYFLEKMFIKDISDYDKERYNDISSNFALKLYEFYKNKNLNINTDEFKSSVSFQIEKIEDNIKNA